MQPLCFERINTLPGRYHAPPRRRWFCSFASLFAIVCVKCWLNAVFVLNKNTAAITPLQCVLLNEIGVGHGICHIGTGAVCCFVWRKEMQSDTRSRACFCQTPVEGAEILCVFTSIFHGYQYVYHIHVFHISSRFTHTIK